MHSQQLYERERTAAVATIMRFQLGKKLKSQLVEFLKRHLHYLLTPSLQQPRSLPSLHSTTKLSRFVLVSKRLARRQERVHEGRRRKGKVTPEAGRILHFQPAESTAGIPQLSQAAMKFDFHRGSCARAKHESGSKMQCEHYIEQRNLRIPCMSVTPHTFKEQFGLNNRAR